MKNAVLVQAFEEHRDRLKLVSVPFKEKEEKCQ